jgi:protein-disulfide isomerase
MDTIQPEQQLTKRQRRELKRQEQAQDKAGQARRKKLTTWLVVVGLIIVIGGLIYWAVTANPSNTNTATDIPAAGHPYLGGANASVVVTEFSDLSCPACAAAAPVIRQLATDYGDRVKFVFYNRDIGHQWSEKSLEAGMCAYQQNKFWEFADLTFSKLADWETSKDAVSILKSYASQVGVDTGVFNTCLDTGATASIVKSDKDLAGKLNVNSTPTFFLNNQQVTITQSFDELKTAIDAELNKAK